MVAGTCVARAHACVRYGAWAGCGAHSESTSCRPRSLCRRRASRSCLATRVIDVPLSGPKRQNSSEKGRARTTRGAGGRQTLPGGPYILYRRLDGPSVHRNSPHATLTQAPDRTLPTSAWIGFALLYCRLPEKGTKMKPWGAAMIKSKTMGLMPRLGAIQWCRLRRDLPSRSLAPAMGTKGGGLATTILNLDLT